MTGRMMRRTAYVVAVCTMAALAACSEPSGPAMAIEGGGFIFNYRIAEVFYGVSVKPLRKFEPGTVLVAEFENPAGGAPFVVRETVAGPRLSYGLRTPGVEGVKAGRPYRVVVTVLSPGGTEFGRLERTFKSDLDQDVNPARPLTIGPGYTRNPDAGQDATQGATPPK